MLSILVGHAYFLNFDRKQQERSKPYPPLATLQVAARLRARGHRVDFFDAMLAQSTADFITSVERIRPQLVVLYEDNYNYLTKMCLGRMRDAAAEMAAAARRCGARVLVAGSDPSDEPGVYLQAGADWVLRGEGLQALDELLQRLDASPRDEPASLAAGLPDVHLLQHGEVISGQALGAASPGALEDKVRPLRLQRTRHEEADAPIELGVAWDLADLESYRAVWTQAHGYFSLNMAASKGCSFRCAWCAKPIWGSRYEQRDARLVAAEMVQLKLCHAPDHIWFADDIFGFRSDWVARFADEVERLGGGLPFTIQTRADLVSDAMAIALRRAGCREVWLGAESGSQRVLDAMDKGTTVAEILQARNRLKAVGIRVGFFIQLGYLGEGLDELRDTRRLIKTARPDDIGVSVAYPLPGTRFHELVQAQLGPKTHWEDSGDLAMMFRGSFSTEFYRSVRDLLHRQVELDTAPGAAPLALARLEQHWEQLLADATPLQTAMAGAGLAASPLNA
ncbi:MAG: Mg-protoporphyrin IX monomethyl ester oxidative cyclase [Roseateles depolymerans]|uniref:Mg-protoporphyrin IX monomethyl ester oxidative cyclase n=1 Tax=Roseateles depolymerans TaxID=76731 RepID=A0A2W5DGB7_9BURK|nr:MAG: Mg-protoporphyrin IX monomethyl ester oxidative cyclase [Roseateles depolymerans]